MLKCIKLKRIQIVFIESKAKNKQINLKQKFIDKIEITDLNIRKHMLKWFSMDHVRELVFIIWIRFE